MKRILIAACAVALFAGCSRAPDTLHAVYRFTDPDLRSRSLRTFGNGWDPEAGYAVDNSRDPKFHVAPIGTDYRYVLANPPNAWLSGKPDLVIPEEGPLTMLPPLPVSLRDCAEVVLLPRIRVEDSWIDLPPQIARPEQRGRDWWLPIELDVPKETRGKSALLNVHAYALRWAAETRIVTPELEIPAGAVFETSIGLMNPLKESHPTTFRVEACEANDCHRILDQSVGKGSEPADVPWLHSRIDLGPLAGKKIRFVFHTIVDGPALAARVFPLWGQPALYAPAPPSLEQKARNVILVSLDTLSARHVSLYGYGHDTMPKMAKRFGENGTVFESCVAAGTATVPSHMTMFTGVYPLESNMTDGMGAVVQGAAPIAALARKHGIETAAFTEDGWISVGLGFGRGFDHFVEDRSPNVMAPEGHAARTFAAARSWLAENREKSFFLFLHTFQVHDPYVPPPPYRDKFQAPEPDKVAGTAPEQIEHRIGYDQEIRYVDDQLDLVLDELDKLGLSDSTVVIVTGDHGEAFGEHGYILHSNYPYEEVSHVPLLMRGPGIAKGRRVAETVGHIDFLPTILELFGIARPHDGLRGKSLVASLMGDRKAPESTNRVMFTESWGTYALTSQHESIPFPTPAFAASDGRMKLVRYPIENGFRYEAFDLENDPHERRDLFPLAFLRFDPLKRLIDRYEADAAAGRKKLESREEAAPGEVHLDPDQEEKLRALGYLQ